jgi:anti-anti-sigma regulatory factor
VTAKRKNVEVITHDPFMEMDVSMKSETRQEKDSTAKESEISASTNDSAAMGNRVILDENLTIQEVGEVVAQVRSAFDLGTPITLEVGGLSRVDGAGVQLLCALFKESLDQQVDIIWNGDSEALNSAAAQLGVAEVMRLSVNG